jgi:AbrB family looped-hinge helix DNA binding protein
MPVAKSETVRLSSKGQLVIPRKIRELLHWVSGTELTVIASGKGVTIQPAQPGTGKRLEKLRGCLKYSGPRVSDEELQAPVDYRAD